MSISSKNTEPEDEKFADVVYDNSDKKEEKSTTEEKVEDTPATAEEEATTEEPKKEKKKDKKKSGGIIDAILLLVLLGGMAGGSYYVYSKMEEFKIPSPMDKEMAKQEELQQHIQEQNTQNAADKISERLELKATNTAAAQTLSEKEQQLANAEKELKQLEKDCADAEKALETAKADYANLDKKQRKEAMSMLSGEGIAIGSITTHDGEALSNAILKKDGNKWRLSGNNGCYNRIIKLGKYNSQLPLIVHYARGKKDLITRGEITEQTAEELAAEREKIDKETVATARNYDPMLAPTVVTQSSESTDIVDDETENEQEEGEFNTDFETESATPAADHEMPSDALPW